MVWWSFPTVRSRTASTTSTPLGSASTTRPAKFSDKVEANVEAPLPLRVSAEVGENRFCKLFAALRFPIKALIPEETLNARWSEPVPFAVAEKLSTTDDQQVSHAACFVVAS